METFMATLFVLYLEEGRFGDILIHYQKVFTNTENKYPNNLLDMIDIMHQSPKKFEGQKVNPKPTLKEEKKEETAFNVAQKYYKEKGMA